MGEYEHKVVPGPISPDDLRRIREAVCVQVEKIYDSCREKDCIENARVFNLKVDNRPVDLTNATNVKVRKAEVSDVNVDIDPVPFKRGYYTVDVKFCIDVVLDIFYGGSCNPQIVNAVGKVFFDKKVILFGSEGGVKIFKAFFGPGSNDYVKEQDNNPIAKIEVAEPIPLAAKIQDPEDKFFDTRGGEEVAEAFLGAEEVNRSILPARRVVVTLGLFSIIKLVRFVQLLIPAFNFCVPTKECIAATEENPCDLFDTIDFPVDEFFPPQIFDFEGALGAFDDNKHDNC